jgi:hypothetical protein
VWGILMLLGARVRGRCLFDPTCVDKRKIVALW